MWVLCFSDLLFGYEDQDWGWGILRSSGPKIEDGVLPFLGVKIEEGGRFSKIAGILIENRKFVLLDPKNEEPFHLSFFRIEDVVEDSHRFRGGISTR